MNFSAKAESMIESAKAVGWDLGLSSIKALLEQLDNPQNKLKTIHVTGTNGKGSTCAFLNSILIDAGYRVGRYVSPAVCSEFERYTINDEWISEESYCKAMDVMAHACDGVVISGLRHPSLFEVETALAFYYFYLMECDLAIIEVGMGGLLDATNVMSSPLICAFTSIGMEHSKWLGDTITDIAKNKAGIIKPQTYVVSALQESCVESILRDTARSNMCDISFAEPIDKKYKLGLVGDFQRQNAGVAIECIRCLRQNGFTISEDNISRGLSDAKWPFRFEQISTSPEIYLDGAHNYHAIVALKQAIIDNISNKTLTFVISVLADKDFDKMFEMIFPLARDIIVVEAPSERALPIEDLYKAANAAANTQTVERAQSFSHAAQLAIDSGNTIVCFGTFTFLNNMKNEFKEKIVD